MKKIVRQHHAREQRRIEGRLQRAAKGGDCGPVLGTANIQYEIAQRARGIVHGGMGLIQRLVEKTGLAGRIDESLHVLKIHRPYHESDHVLNLAYNALCGGQRLEDIELRRKDRGFLDALGARSIPDPTTAGDFCRRLTQADLEPLMDAINETRLGVWQGQPKSFRDEVARIDADGTTVATEGECKGGMDIAFNGVWGYHPLLISLANTGEPLFVVNRSGNRPSHEGAPRWFDKAIALCRRARFRTIRLRGDTDFSLTAHFDRWSEQGVEFVFGFDARKGMIERAEAVPGALYRELEARAERARATGVRTRPENVKDRIVGERGFEVIRTLREEIVEFEYQPVKCRRTYRIIALRKTLETLKHQEPLFEDVRYFFYITNIVDLSADQIVHEARQRCNQENLIDQLKNGVRALHAPVNTLEANWAYMVMTALAWSLKAWLALMLPLHPRWIGQHQQQRRRLLTMDFRTFHATWIQIPCQIVKSGGRIVYRLLAWNHWQPTLFRLLDAI